MGFECLLSSLGGRPFCRAQPMRDTFHERAIEEGRFYEERVAANLSNLVFGQVFPDLARAIAVGCSRKRRWRTIRDATLILLYRLLFILYRGGSGPAAGP